MAEHFIQFERIPLIYGRVPKVANSSVKAALTRLLEQPPEEGLRSTADAFWRRGTHGETCMIDAQTALLQRATHLIFSFVRNPFDRLVSAYNNKLVEIASVPGAMERMGLERNMPFEHFLEVVAGTDDADLDVHLLPQSTILCIDGVIVPSFIGKLEAMPEHWQVLRRRMRQWGLPALGRLPSKNVRRGSDTDLQPYFNTPRTIELALERYRLDVELFYPDQPIEQLATGNLDHAPALWERFPEPVGSLA
ncbi:sulfotransferase family protein [Cyanobium sp. CH-040]|uniref:sulfotransferase family protein n=1 Tax=Cyanobium sp. CH-040 TaxID=2823708 RepID=UPI0020CB7734|nr:sulfotransferase family protein [Cyanobium sp. CH-040]MCP9928019.1 sulfotransferase family protein [Cyanobium sp. CH-040]